MASNNDDAVRVTDQNFGDLLIEGLHEALAVSRGEREPARRVRRLVSAREAVVQPPRPCEAQCVQQIREKLGLSQAVFARVLNASAETVKAWEQGKRQPDGMALTLLEIAETHPEALLSRVRTRAAAQPRRKAAAGR